MDNNNFDRTPKHPPLSLPFYYGWFVVSLCFLTTLISAGVRSSPSVLIHPLESEFGWSRALIASAISMNLLLFGVAAPISGFLLDRYGPRKVMLGSLALLIAGVSGTILMTQFWQFFLVWGIIVGLGAGGVGSVLTATVGNRWFVARRGLALGILGSASSTGQIIFLPFVWQFLRLRRHRERIDWNTPDPARNRDGYSGGRSGVDTRHHGCLEYG